MHPLLVGGNPFTTTSIYGLILYLEKKWGIHYSMNGTGNIIKGFEKLMNEVGINIIKGHEVIKINSNGNKITGIQLDDKTNIKSNNVICNADPPAVYEKMLNGNIDNSLLFKWKKSNTFRFKGQSRSITIYCKLVLGLQKRNATLRERCLETI